MVSSRNNNVKVIVRTRPTSNFSKDHYIFDAGADSIDLIAPEVVEKKKGGSLSVADNQTEQWHFQVDRLLVNCSQQEVYKHAARDLVRSAFEGINGAVIAYGHTGAGKTYTMVGSTSSYEHRGIIPRVLADLFKEKEERTAMIIDIKLSYLEIYNEALSDLLATANLDIRPGDSITSDLTMYEDLKQGVQVKGLRRVPVEGEEDALAAFYSGESNRSMGETMSNKRSTRSHTILTVYVSSRSKLDSAEKIIYSKIHLVDLAGSERTKVSPKTESRVAPMEVSSINKSCTYLEQVVLALASRNREHVPYRQSKLTYLLKDSLGGNCRSVLIAAIWPEARHFEETASTLRFASRVRCVSNSPGANVDMDPIMLLRKYEKDIKQLQQELGMHDILAGRHTVRYDDYSPEEVEELEKRVVRFLKGEDADFEVESIQQVTEAFKIVRRLYQSISSELLTLKATQEAGPEQAKSGVSEKVETPMPSKEETVGKVGEEVRDGVGFSAGLAGDDGAAAPPRVDAEHIEASGDTRTAGHRKQSAEAAPSRQTAYAEFRKQHGHAYDDRHRALAARAKELRSAIRALASSSNSTIDQIDRMKLELSRFQDLGSEREADDSGNIILDEDEYRILRDLAEAKKGYRSMMVRYGELQEELQHCWKQIAENKRDLLDNFAVWFLKEYGEASFMIGSDNASEKVNECFPTAVRSCMDKQDNLNSPQLDAGEQFDSLEDARARMRHPDAVPFYRATKTRRQRNPRK
ncbi:kif9, putative [Perkinsus marinus ATCC 50983]|uniref:Kinesin-like protein n=1 Tax=Perkinsus marinus (strain ATCC 50983 / TXsc) TaxID=423536 RepID=C5K7U8_PERM5|nr:kif9, putative [Perkinsus marinus ATCC 50983]EER19633.1 kif9, putative [Perkinsus marinus ATCC 50983]|eukprot:XP_002787837.1 kif9, putative [Perkinsus marinus ATCC 50983]